MSTIQNALAAAWVILALGNDGAFGATTKAPPSASPQFTDAERVKITTDIVQDCMTRREVTEGQGDIGQRLVACVNARLANEGKPWRWSAGPGDITLEKK